MNELETEKSEGQVYELCFLILPSIAEDKLGEVTSKIRSIVTKEDGFEIDAEEPFKHPLAYPMSKTVGASRYVVSDAYIGWIKFELETSKAPEVKDMVEKLPEILRFLLVKAPRETSFTFAKAKEALQGPVLEDGVVGGGEKGNEVDGSDDNDDVEVVDDSGAVVAEESVVQ